MSPDAISWIKHLRILDQPKLKPFLISNAEDIFPRLMVTYNRKESPAHVDLYEDDADGGMVELSDSE